MFEFINHQLKTNPFFLTAILASVGAAFILYFKNSFKYTYDFLRRKLVFTAVVYQNDPLFNDFEVWFYANYGEKYKNVEASAINGGNYDSPMEYSDARKKHKVYFKQSEGVFFIKYNGTFILIKKGKEKLDHAQDVRSMFLNQYHFYAIKGAESIKKLLEDAVVFADKSSKTNELKIYTHTAYGDWVAPGRISSKDINNVIINKEKLVELIKDMDEFKSSKQDYDRRGIFYKRGYCFHGSPGNGKTSLALAMATYLERDIYCLDLNTLNANDCLKTLFSNLKNNSLLLLEDFDCTFKLREPVRVDSKISFSAILNSMDGATYREGLVIILTTNKFDYLDDALIRAGRMDFIFEVPKPGYDEVNSYLKLFYNTTQNIPNGYFAEMSMCDIQGICLKNKNDYQQTILDIKNRNENVLLIS